MVTETLKNMGKEIMSNIDAENARFSFIVLT